MPQRLELSCLRILSNAQHTKGSVGAFKPWLVVVGGEELGEFRPERGQAAQTGDDYCRIWKRGGPRSTQFVRHWAYLLREQQKRLRGGRTLRSRRTVPPGHRRAQLRPLNCRLGIRPESQRIQTKKVNGCREHCRGAMNVPFARPFLISIQAVRGEPTLTLHHSPYQRHHGISDKCGQNEEGQLVACSAFHEDVRGPIE